MMSPQVVVVVMWTLSTSVTVLADLRYNGPYVVDLMSFSPCEDKGSILVKFDVKYTVVDFNDDDEEPAYYGYLTFPYDVDDENILTTITAYQWGSTGGWGQEYVLEEYDIMNYLMKDFPEVFRSTFGSMGVKGKPMPAGTYHVQNYFPRGFKLKNLPELPYGRHRLVVIQSRNGTELCCLQFEVKVKEIPNVVVERLLRKAMRRSG